MPTLVDARPLTDWIHGELEPAVRRGGRGYARRLDAPVADVYGTADMACILHTIGALDPSGPSDADAWQPAFDALQNSTTGHFDEREPSHLPVHATAFSVAAMRLLGLRPAHPLRFLGPEATCDGIAPWLEDRTWDRDTYLWSHDIAGVASLAALCPEQFEAGWTGRFFTELERYLDPATGMFGRDKPADGDLDQIGGTFHHAFVYEHHRRRLAHAPARVRAVLGRQRPDGLWDQANPIWLTLDGVYLLTRGARDAPENGDDARIGVARAVTALQPRLADPGTTFGDDMGVHSLTAAVSTLAEAQRFLGPDAVVSDAPLRLVLDVRPFV